MNTIIYSILILATSIPTAYILHKLTFDEKKLTNFYFPPLLWILAITSAILYSINIQYALTTTHMFFTILIWHRMNNISRKKRKKLNKKTTKYFCPKCKSKKVFPDTTEIGIVLGFQPALRCQKCGFKSKGFPKRIESSIKNKRAKK